jgi:hypothetical protein
MYLLAIRKLLIHFALRKLIQDGAFAIFRSIRLKIERDFKVWGSKVDARKESVSYVLIRILAGLIPDES